MAELRHSVAVTLSRISDKLHLVYGREAVCCFKFHGMNNTTTSTHQRYSQKDVLRTPGISLAVNSLQL